MQIGEQAFNWQKMKLDRKTDRAAFAMVGSASDVLANRINRSVSTKLPDELLVPLFMSKKFCRALYLSNKKTRTKPFFGKSGEHAGLIRLRCTRKPNIPMKRSTS